MEINLYTFSFFINTIASIFFGFFIFLKGKRSDVSRSWLWICLSVAVCFTGLNICISTVDPHLKPIALIGARVGNLACIWIPVFFLRFVIALLDIKKQKQNTMRLAYALAIFFSCFSFSPWFINEVRPIAGYKYMTKSGGPLYGAYFIHFSIWAIYANYLLFKYCRILSEPKRKPVLIVAIGMTIGFICGSFLYLVCFDINYNPWPSHFTSVYNLIIFYGILRYQLMDIELIVKKALVFTVLFVLMGALFIGSIFTIQSMIGKYIALDPKILYGLVLFFGLLSFKYLDVLLTNLTDRFLFQKKYDYQSTLQNFTKSVINILNEQELINKTEEIIKRSIKPEKVKIAVNHFNDTEKRNSFEKRILIQSETRQWGELLLSRKLSGESYTEEDINLLNTLAGQLAIAFQNIQSLEESVRAQAQVQQASKMATVGILAASINHELKNPLYIAKGELESYLMTLEQCGPNKNKEVEKMKQEVTQLMKRSIDQIDRSTNIMKTFSSFSKPSSEISTESVDLKAALDRVLVLLRHEFKYSETRLVINLPENLPQLLMNPLQLEQILLNLLINACHAIEGSAGSQVCVSTNIVRNEKEQTSLTIEISDTGKGIPAEYLPKVFEPFFTTKGTRGTGLGLYITKKIIEANGGKIEVQSKMNEGTAFTIKFPIIKLNRELAV